MKMLIRNRFMVICICAANTTSLLAADPQNVVSNSGGDLESKKESEIRGKFAELSQKLNESPQLKELKAKMNEAQNAYKQAFEAAMKSEDPELLEQYKASIEAFRQRMVSKPSGETNSEVFNYSKLTEEQRSQLAAARQQAMGTPAVKDARSKRNGAKTEEERKSAEAEYRTALRNAMLESNPKLSDLINEVYGSKPQ